MLMQFQSDLLDRPLSASTAPEVSALGAAALAFEGMGIATSTAEPGNTYQPQMNTAARTDRLLHWQAAIRQTLAQ